VQIKTTACTEADHRVLTQLKKQQGHSASSLTTRYVRTYPDGQWPLWKYKRTACKHTDHTQSTHLIGKISIESWPQKGEKL
jgi:hypothetical protein